jgi:hypothetical protein
MTAIVASLLASGGWGLVVGWILPTALNSLLFGLLVLPALQDVSFFHAAFIASGPVKALALLVLAVVFGLVLSAFQTPLYRLLEGYSWPLLFRRSGIRRQLAYKTHLEEQLELARLVRREQSRTLREGEANRLQELQSQSPASLQKAQRWEVSVLAERLRRYPVDNDQVLPSRLGNAIRRFEEYAYDRYCLDVVIMWYALMGAVSDQVRKQVDASRAGVDFFVCLIYGHVIVALFGLAALGVGSGRPAGPSVAIVGALVLSFLWYRLAVSATDEWAAAVRGLADLGRKPLAESLGLALPATLEMERQMWQKVSRLGRQWHTPRDFELDRFRVSQAALPPGTPFVVEEDDPTRPVEPDPGS